MVTYSDWIWSEEHKKYYCAVYDDDDQIVEYQWEGGYRQPIQRELRSSDLSHEEGPRYFQTVLAMEQWRNDVSKHTKSQSARSDAQEVVQGSRWFREHEWDGPRVEPQTSLPMNVQEDETLYVHPSSIITEKQEVSSREPDRGYYNDVEMDMGNSVPTMSVAQSAAACAEKFRHPNAFQKQGKRSRRDFDTLRTRFCIWHATFASSAPTLTDGFHGVDPSTNDVLLGILDRLSHLLQTLIEGDVAMESLEARSPEDFSILDSSTTSSDDGETDASHKFQGDISLQRIDSIISRLYRLTSFTNTPNEYNSMSHVPYEHKPVSDERDTELFAERVRSHIAQQCPELFETVLQNRLIKQSIHRRSELACPGLDSARTDSGASLQFTNDPRNEDIERWETIFTNFPPMPVQEANNSKFICPYCLQDVSSLLGATMGLHLWRQHLLEDSRPYVCLFPDCVDVALRFAHVGAWISHMTLQHSARYYCQFPGHESFHFLSPNELELHLTEMHETSIPPGQTTFIAKKGKRPGPDAIDRLILEWNRDNFEKENFIVCGLCGVRRFGFSDPSTEGRDVEQYNIDTLREGGEGIPGALRMNILNHLSHHLEELALLSFPISNNVGKGKSADPLTLPTASNIPSNHHFNQTPCDWLKAPDSDKRYRWRYDAEGIIQYQWGITQSSYGPHDSELSGDQMFGPKYQDSAKSLYQSSSRSSYPKSQYSIVPSHQPSSVTSYSQSLYSRRAINLDYASTTPYTYTTAFEDRSSAANFQSLPEDIQKTVGGNKPNRHIETRTDGLEYEKLHPSFKRVAPRNHEAFFTQGRVFKMLWVEPVGQPLGKSRGSTHFSFVGFQEGSYSEIRRFVVIQNKGTFSQCLPIQTYRGKGATKPGLIVSDHAIVYTGPSGSQPPVLFEGEEPITKQAIRVVPVDPVGGELLHSASRINFGKPYAVEHNVKVAEIGSVSSEHQHLLITYFKEAMGIA